MIHVKLNSKSLNFGSLQNYIRHDLFQNVRFCGECSHWKQQFYEQKPTGAMS